MAPPSATAPASDRVVTHVDGLVPARSAFHHSINDRSVVVLGTATLVDDPAEKLRALEVVTDQVVPGRWAEVRGPSAEEDRATSVLRLPLDECSAKARDAGIPVPASVTALVDPDARR